MTVSKVSLITISCLIGGLALTPVHKAQAAKKAKAGAAKAAAAPAPAGKADSGPIAKAAEAAMKARDYELAVSLWRGVIAINGDADPAAWKLAEAFTLGGEFDLAQDALETYAEATKDPKEKQKAQEEIASLAKRERGYGGKAFTPRPAVKEAADAFKKGRAAYKKKQYELAIAYFKAGSVMAPDLAGNYRELGESLDALGRSAEANEFFVHYLNLRPFTKNKEAKSIFDRLGKAKLLATVDIVSALPCKEVWVNGQQLDPKKDKLPLKARPMAPGKYKFLCFNDDYHIVQFESLEVKAGDKATLEFQWALIVNKLQPPGRIVIEDPLGTGTMHDIGVWPEIGVPVPKDRRALKMKITEDGDSSHTKDELLKLEPGKRVEVKW